MAVDYVRIYKPESLLDPTPETDLPHPAAEVELELLFPENQAQPFLDRVTDLTSGTVDGLLTGQEYRAFPISET